MSVKKINQVKTLSQAPWGPAASQGPPENAGEMMTAHCNSPRVPASVTHVPREAWLGGHPILQMCTQRPRAPGPPQVPQGASELSQSCAASTKLLYTSWHRALWGTRGGGDALVYRKF